MKKFLLSSAFSLGLCAAAWAAPESTLRGGFAVCDPNAPSHCGQVSTPGALFVDNEGLKASFSVGFDHTGYTTPTDLWCINGSATKTVRVRHVQVNGQATAAIQVDLILLKRSTADTGGTPTAITPTPYDSALTAATATVASYTAAPTTGTLVGSAVFDQQINLPAPGGGNPPFLFNWIFGGDGATALVLRGVGEGLCLNWAGAAFPAGGKLSTTVEWTEE